MQSLLFSILFYSFLALLISARPIPITGVRRTAADQNATWNASGHLLNPRSGSRALDLDHVRRHFVRFGYLEESDDSNSTSDHFDRRFESAVALYQSRLGLPVTRRLDSVTLSHIMTPRCGVPDTSEPNRTGRLQRFMFFPGRPRWASSGSGPLNLTYALSTDHAIDYVDRKEVRAALRRAFLRWARVIPVRFEEVTDYKAADVKVGFYSGDHGDGEPFDGVLGILGHAFSPESGQMHLDAAERWAVGLGKDASKNAVDLESVMTHEIGHVLGLGHSAVAEAVMYPTLKPRTRKVDLRVDDVEGVQALYGSNPDFNFSQLVAPETSAAPAKAGRRAIRICLRRSCVPLPWWIAVLVLLVA